MTRNYLPPSKPCSHPHCGGKLRRTLLLQRASCNMAYSPHIKNERPTLSRVFARKSWKWSLIGALSYSLIVLVHARRPIQVKQTASSFIKPRVFWTRKDALPPSNRRPSLLVSLKHQLYVGEGADNNPFPTGNSGKNMQSTLFPKEIRDKFSSFSSNISRYRVERKRLTKSNKKSRSTVDNSIVSACSSLVYFLREEAEKLLMTKQQVEIGVEAAEFVRENLEMVLIQAVRGASEIGDFVLLPKLVYAAVEYATVVANLYGVALLKPRVFGEAISSLSKTKASTSKLKALWNFFINDVTNQNQAVLVQSPSAYELNSMLSGLARQGKVKAALKLYREIISDNGESIRIEGDPYTASLLFSMLKESIHAGAASDSVWKEEKITLMRKLGSIDVNDEEDKILAAEGSLLEESSPCWQWNEALELLETFSPSQLNNHAYSALLKINERAAEEYCEANLRHNGVKWGMAVLDKMKKDKIPPDVVTCSTLMAAFDKSRNWKASVSLLNAMEASSPSNRNPNVYETKWSLPEPNRFTYSLAISTCARCEQGDTALLLLDKMTASSNDIVGDTRARKMKPNTWVYNAALLACAESNHSPGAKTNSNHLITAFGILEKMENGGFDEAPDTVSYNTILSAIDESSFVSAKELYDKSGNRKSYLSKHDDLMKIVVGILDSMEARGVSRDSITYYNAIMTFSDPNNAIALLRMAFEDSDAFSAVSVIGKSPSRLKGRAASGKIFVANAALSIAASSGDISAVSEILALIHESDVDMNVESIKYIIQALGKIGDCESILALLICLRGQSFANDILKERYSLDILASIPKNSTPIIEEEIYSTAITACLSHDELGMADQILLSMKKNGLTLNQRSLKGIISEYCRMAMSSSKEEFKIARVAKRLDSGVSLYGIVEPCYITSRARAKAALAMLKAVEVPSPGLLSPVAKACCAAGLWQEARSILRRMHRAALRELRQDSTTGMIEGKFLSELPRLHRSLLKFCAKGGNITPALNFADDIQFLASRIRQHAKSFRGLSKNEELESGWITLSSRLLMDTPTPDNAPESDFSDGGALSTVIDRPIGLTGQDWKLILIAASRGGHWKVCVGTLPFIRPYVKETHPKYARESLNLSDGRSSSRPSLERLNRKYNRIARALTAAVLCFESRSQYAWAIRAIDDWIEWSGRRPRKEAVTSACRILAKRYRGQEVINLVTKVINIPSVETTTDDPTGEATNYTYEKAVYTESINALHKSGLYEEADQLYAQGAAAGHLPWATMQNVDDSQLKLDLHGMSAAVAHSAVRVSLQKETMNGRNPIESSEQTELGRDVIIVTGRGRRSGERFRPILRPEVQRMLTEEFYPPISTSSLPGNMGALLVPKQDINAWLNHQRHQKGERILFVADILRDLTTGSRLERALRKRITKIPTSADNQQNVAENPE